MKKTKIYISFFCCLLSVALTYSLQASQDLIYNKQEFVRKIQPPVKIEIVQKNDDNAKIISISRDTIVMINNSFNNVSLISGKTATEQQIIPDNLKSGMPYFFLNGGAKYNHNIYSFCGNCQTVIGSLPDKTIAYTLGFTYTNPTSISENTFIFRENSDRSEFIIGKYNLQTKQRYASNLNNHMPYNGGLATTGTLAYDGKSSLFFVNRYNSTIVKFDTMLRVNNVFRTIDRSTKLPSVVYLDKIKSYKFSSPKKAINDRIALSKKFLFISSMLHAKNESNVFTYKNHCIDIYDTKSGQYVSSCYIEKKFGSSIIDMIAKNDKQLSVLTEKNLLTITIQ
jgi:hypothetical protein